VDTLIGYLQTLLSGSVPTEALGVLLGLGAIVATITGIIRYYAGNIKNDTLLLGIVVAVSFGLDATVFAKYGLLDKHHVGTLIVAVALTASSAVCQHQALKKVVKPLAVKAFGGDKEVPP
jgi:hypothetical protein